MTQPKAVTNSGLLEIASNTSKFNYEAFNDNHINFYNLHKNLYGKKKFLTEMQSETIILCEINACLWVKAINSALCNLTEHTYSHYIIVQKFINYILNTDSTENLGLIENYFWKLLLTHPPSPDMFDYYWQLVFDNFICLNGKETENQTLFFCLMETITNCLKVKVTSEKTVDFNKHTIRSVLSIKSDSSLISFNSQSKLLEMGKSLNINSNKSSPVKSIQKQIYFDKLPQEEKIKRCLIVLNFLYNILETDFMFWLHLNEFKPTFDNNRPLLSHLLWKNQRDIGLLNKEIKKLFQLYELVMNSNIQNIYNICVIDKFVTLIGEIIRWSDCFEETKYPFVGSNSASFFRELSLILYQRVVEMKNNLNENVSIVNFKPPWLRLFLCSHLLTLITRHQCIPELTGVYYILEHIVCMPKKDSKCEKTTYKSSVTTNLLKKKREKFKNVNAKHRNGKTPLHLACECNDIGKIKTLLTFPDLDVNAVDRNGWSALHIAADKGKTATVKELLLFCPPPGSIQKPANTRSKGPRSTTPLMCAASQGHTEICRLLLEHSGSILLEDLNEFNQTALDLTNASAVRRILKYYETNCVWTENSFKDINFDLDLKKVVIKLCVEMIQAYFSTYKTWDIWKILKQSENVVQENITAELKFDYLRYDRDIKININKLKSLLPKLEFVEEFESFKYTYNTIFSFNK